MKSASAKDKDDEKVSKMGSEAPVISGGEEKRAKLTMEEPESQRRVENKVRNIDLQFDLEKAERDSGMNNKQGHKQHQLPSSSKAAKDEPHGEKTGEFNKSRMLFSCFLLPSNFSSDCCCGTSTTKHFHRSLNLSAFTHVYG